MTKLLGYRAIWPAIWLAAFALAVVGAVGPAAAQVPPIQPPPGLASNAGNATLPAARNNLGAGPMLAAKDYGAVGNGTTDDTAALGTGCTAAAAAAVPLGLSGTYKVSTSLPLTCDLTFTPGAMLVPDTGKTVTITGKIDASDVANLFGGAGTVIAATAPHVSVAWWGAMVVGVDAAPAFRAALGNNRTVRAPPASYTFKSVQTTPCCALDNAGVLVQLLHDFVLDLDGATIQMDNAHTLSAIIHIDQSQRWSMHGLTCAGNRTGRAATDENACWAMSSDVGFVIRDIKLTGNWGGAGTITYGDWLVNGLIENIRADAVGLCFDLAFLKDVTIAHVRAVGADTNGAQGAGQVGQKCVSNVYDVPNAATNNTGVTFTDTAGVTVIDVDASNFNTGWTVQSGNYYKFIGNYWHDNPGLGATAGNGGQIKYVNGGASSSVGHPPGHIQVIGDRVANNGVVINSAGILISSAAISNGDLITDLNINAAFDNNSTQAIEADATTGISGVTVTGSYSGANQTAKIGSNLTASLTSQFGAGLTTGGAIRALGAEGTQFQMALGGQEWRLSAQSGANWYVHDFTNSRFPFTIQPNTALTYILGTAAHAFTGAATFSSTINKVTVTPPATGATLTIADGKTATHNSTTTFAGADGKTLTINNSLTLAGTDATTMTFPSVSKTLMASDYSNGTTLTANALLTGGGAGAAPNAVAITGLVKGNGASAPAAYGGASCTNQFPRSLDLNGAATCASVANADLAGSIAASKLVGTDIATVGTLTAGSINWTGNIVTTGTLLNKALTVSKTSAYPVVAADAGTHFDNIGAAGSVTFTLPAAAAGLNYCFLVSAAQTVVVAAASGEKVAIGLTNSAATGNITATAAFSQACVEAHAASQWVARSVTGTWTVN